MQDAGYHCDKLVNRHVCHRCVAASHFRTKTQKRKVPPAPPARPRKGYEPYIHFPLKTSARGRQAVTQHCVTKHKSATLLNEEGDHGEC
jgi:hypothetical protein